MAIDAAGNYVPDSPLPLNPFAPNAPLPGQYDPSAAPVVQSATDLAAQQAAQYQAPPLLAAAPVPAPVAAPVPAPPPVNTTGLVPVHENPGTAMGTGGGGIQVPSIAGEVAMQHQASQDIQKAQLEQGQALASESDAEAAARKAGAAQLQIQQDQIKAMSAQRDADVQRINEDQQRAYDEAHNTTIPDFWEGSPGRHAAAAISMALGQAGAGLTAFATGANVGNTAKDIIDNQIKQYAVTQREKIDNLFKYAAAKNQLGEEQKANWAAKLNDLQYQMAAMHQSVADHVLEVAAAAKGRVNQAQAQVLASTQQQAGQQLEIAARKDGFNMQAKKRELGFAAVHAQAAMISANAQKTAAEQTLTAKADEGAYKTYVQPHQKAADEMNRRIEGFNSALSTIDNPSTSSGEVTSAIEKGIAADSGAGTRGVSMGQLHSILPNLTTSSGAFKDSFSNKWDGTAGAEYRAAAKRLVEEARASRLQTRASNRKALETTLAGTPHGKTDPEFAKRGAAALYPDLETPPAAPAPAPSYPEGSKSVNALGKPIYFSGGKWHKVGQ